MNPPPYALPSIGGVQTGITGDVEFVNEGLTVAEGFSDERLTTSYPTKVTVVAVPTALEVGMLGTIETPDGFPSVRAGNSGLLTKFGLLLTLLPLAVVLSPPNDAEESVSYSE